MVFAARDVGRGGVYFRDVSYGWGGREIPEVAACMRVPRALRTTAVRVRRYQNVRLHLVAGGRIKQTGGCQATLGILMNSGSLKQITVFEIGVC